MSTGSVLLLVVGWLVGWWLLWRVPVLSGEPDPRTLGDGGVADVSVVIPARDEEGSLPALLASLVAQDVRPRQILVVDDQSSDGTAAVAAAVPGVTVIASNGLPAGWTGKAWACEQGAARAVGRRLLFLDADVTLAPGALAALLATHDRHGGLLSVQPHHRVVRPYEHLSAAFNVIGVMGVGMAGPGRRGRARAAFGPCMVIGREDHRRVGGHAAVRGEIIEDVAFGRRCADAGLPVRALGGGRLVSFRMYPDGPAQLLEGWSKNFAAGAGATPAGRLALVAVWVAATLASTEVVVRGLLGAEVPLPVGVGTWLGVAAQQRAMLRQVGTFGWVTAALYPVTLAAFVAVFARSLWLSLVRREVTWRGRPIPLDEQRRWAPVPGEAPGTP